MPQMAKDMMPIYKRVTHAVMLICNKDGLAHFQRLIGGKERLEEAVEIMVDGRESPGVAAAHLLVL